MWLKDSGTSTTDLFRIEVGLDEHLELLQHEVLRVFFPIRSLWTERSAFLPSSKQLNRDFYFVRFNELYSRWTPGLLCI